MNDIFTGLPGYFDWVFLAPLQLALYITVCSGPGADLILMINIILCGNEV